MFGSKLAVRRFDNYAAKYEARYQQFNTMQQSINLFLISFKKKNAREMSFLSLYASFIFFFGKSEVSGEL